MKRNENMIVRKITGTNVIIPIGQSVVDSKSMMKLNETGAFILQTLETPQTKEQLLDAMIVQFQPANEEEYNQLKADLTAFIDQAISLNIVLP